jgi:hypothetical protein
VGLPSTTTHHAPPVAQTSSQFRNTGPPAPAPLLGSPMQVPHAPIAPSQSPRLARYPSQRVNPVNVPSPRVNHTLPRNIVVPLTPHPASANAPYVPQGMTGVNLFDTFEEEHMETPSLPRCNTRSRARQQSANNDNHHAPRVFHPITFTNTQGFHSSPKQAITQIPMANAVINHYTGASLEYRQLIQDETTFPVWNKVAANECGCLAQGVGGRIEGSHTIFFIPRQAIPKEKIGTYGHFLVDIRTNKT